MLDSEPGRFRAWRARRRQKKEESQLRTWLAVIFVITVLGGGILVILVPRDWITSTPANGPAPAVQLPMPGPVPEIVPVCQPQEAADASTADLTQPPPTNWVFIGKTATPQIEGVGPLNPGQYRQCYVRTPIGALLSITNYISLIVNLPVPERVLLNEARMSRQGEYANRQALLKEAVAPQSSDPAPTPQFAGYRWVSYSPDVAVIQLAYKTDSAMWSMTYTLVWQANDWLVTAAPLGGLPTAYITSLANYIPWSSST